MPIDKKTLLKKSIAKAIQSPGNLVTGAVCLAASAVLWNPLPLILWGLAATGWVSLAATGDKYIRQIEDEERREQEMKAERSGRYCASGWRPSWRRTPWPSGPAPACCPTTWPPTGAC